MNKDVSGIMLILLVGMLTLAFNVQPAKAEPRTIYVDDDNVGGPWDGTLKHPYQDISTALKQASENDTIFVNDGTYNENVIVNKTVTLVGENPKTTIIDGNKRQMSVVLINRNGVKIKGFTIQNSGVGVLVGGIHVWKSQRVEIYNNLIRTSYPGLLLTQSKYCEIFENQIVNNVFCGIYLHDNSSYNQIVGNTIINHTEGIHFADSSSEHNNFHHNNFINNTRHVWSMGSVNTWDDGYPSGGNYWSDYIGDDIYSGAYQNVTGSDGIGDTPYVIDGKNDSYPLMAQINFFDVGAWDRTAYNVDVISNFAVSNFQLDIDQKMVSFNVTGEAGLGFCRVTIPNVIIQGLWRGNYTVLLNGEPWLFTNWTDNANAYIYINYIQPGKVIIIPEFPSAVTLLFLIVYTMLIIFAKNVRKFH